MSVALRPVGPARRVLGRLLDGAGQALLVVVLGVVVGLQYITPNRRVLQLLAASVLLGLAWRASLVSGLGMLALALPFPRGTTFGSTNLAFVLLLLVIWMLRVTQRQSAPPARTPLDAPLAALFVSYVVSFYNVASVQDLTRALEHFEVMVACGLMFYLIVNNVRTVQDLQRLHLFQAVSVSLVCLAGLYELNHPGQALIRGWIYFASDPSLQVNVHNLRIGSVFNDYELLSEYAAINLLFAIFLLLRARALLARLLLGAFVLVVALVLFATTTRGSVVALAVALLYFVWLLRRRLNFVTLVVTVALVVGGFWAMDAYVSTYTRSGSVIERLLSTKLIGGLPDSRAEAWPPAFERMLQHPFIGHGPYYSAQTGIRTWTWPHSLYLYVGNNVGFIGLGIFLWFLWRLWRISRPGTDDLRHPDYARAFQIVAHVQLAVFVVDQIKIEFLRNMIYQFQVWWMFAMLVAAHQLVARGGAAGPRASARPRAA